MENNVLNIDGKEFSTENLKDEQKALIDQIGFCQNQRQVKCPNLQFKV